MTGRTIRHYRIGERLGAGGMGEVYRGEDLRLGRPVALKFLTPGARGDPESRQRILKEARAASLLRSPNIAVTYDIVEEDGSLFIVMEFVEGELLSTRIERGPLSSREAVELSMQTADALDEAHSRGIIHRDIKSANLMITARGLVKLLDFGLAKTMGPRNAAAPPDPGFLEVTSPGVILGTVSYMSPEQALGRPLDHRSDLFSLGVVMYQMLSGRLPFQGGSLTEIVDRILHQEPTALPRLIPGLRVELADIVRKALEKEPGSRYQAARELYVDLRNLKREMESAERAARTTRAPSGGLTPANGGGVPAVQPPRLENAVAVMTFSNITREPGDDWIGTGIAETVTADLKSIRGLSVLARAQVFEALQSLSSTGRAELDERVAIDLGHRLGASWIVGGGYQRLGPLVRITAQLLDVRTGALTQTVKVDGQIGEIFNLQDRIVYGLSEGLKLKLERGEIAEIERKETESVEAYEAYSRGVLNLRTADRDSLDRAVYLFEKALEHDPRYGSAWAALGGAHTLKGGFLSIPELVEKGIECERKALALNPRLSSAHSWLGMALNNIGRYEEAIEATREALRLEPQSASAHSSLARSYWMGKGMIAEGVAELEHAVALNPEMGYAYLQLAFLRALLRDYPRASAAARQAIELQERSISGNEGLQIIGAHGRLGYVHYRQGLHDEAILEYGREIDFMAQSGHILRERTLIEVHQKMGAAYLKKGLESEAARHFDLAVKMFEARLLKGADDPFTKYYIAVLYALRGDAERAVKYLGETLAQLRPLNTWRAREDPDFDGLRDHPGFRKLVEPA
jgi:serine/threonine protein kinase/Tfp pilus assembly protein PilF